MSQISAVGVSSGIAVTSMPQSNFKPEVAAAVAKLNGDALFGADREVIYSFDRTTHLPVVRVLDSQTKEVINQWPPEFALQLAFGDIAKDTGDS